MNLLILSCGTRNLLVRYFKESSFNKIVVTDCSLFAPALYEADSYHIVPRMDAPDYLSTILSICEQENIQAILPLQEDELTLVSTHRNAFEEKGITVIVSDKGALELCRDKYKFYCHLKENQIPVLKTYQTLDSFQEDYRDYKVKFPVFIKPVRGAGSIGAMKVSCMEVLEVLCKHSDTTLLIQEYCEGREFGADCYIDLITHQVTDVFIKEKLRMRAGETDKSVTVNNPKLKRLVVETLESLQLVGPIDMDVFEKDGQYYISEINPRFGGGFPHAYACGMNVPAYIAGNICGSSTDSRLNHTYPNIHALKFSDVLTID